MSSIKLGRNEDTAKARSLPLVTKRNLKEQANNMVLTFGCKASEVHPALGDFIPRKSGYSDSEMLSCSGLVV